MKKGDLVRLIVSDVWTARTAETDGYLWLVDIVRDDGVAVRCTSLATGDWRVFYAASLEQANEER